MRRKQLKNNMIFRKHIQELLFGIIDEHLETYQDGEMRDFIDSYIQHMNQSSAESSFYSEEGSKWTKYFSPQQSTTQVFGGCDNLINWLVLIEKNLYVVLLDLFVGMMNF